MPKFPHYIDFADLEDHKIIQDLLPFPIEIRLNVCYWYLPVEQFISRFPGLDSINCGLLIPVGSLSKLHSQI